MEHHKIMLSHANGTTMGQFPRLTLVRLGPQVPDSHDGFIWEAFNHAKEYASEARDRTPPPLPMEAESTTKSCCHEACDSPATPITPATHHHSPSPEAPCTCHNSEDSYNDCKDPVTHGLCVGVITDTLVITELRGVRVVQIP